MSILKRKTTPETEPRPLSISERKRMDDLRLDEAEFRRRQKVGRWLAAAGGVVLAGTLAWAAAHDAADSDARSHQGDRADQARVINDPKNQMFNPLDMGNSANPGSPSEEQWGSYRIDPDDDHADTYANIAQQIMENRGDEGDYRPLEDRLIDRNGGDATIYPGQSVEVPADADLDQNRPGVQLFPPDSTR